MGSQDADSSEREMLVAFLRDHSRPCPACGYDLARLTTDRCPECGRRLRITVSEANPPLAPFITGVAFSVPIGGAMNGMIGVAVGRYTYSVAWPSLIRPLTINAVTFVMAVAALTTWLLLSRAIRRRTPRQQWLLAAAAWGADVLVYAVCVAVW
jgi:hypothetical protein